jgi:hypothetical protein
MTSSESATSVSQLFTSYLWRFQLSVFQLNGDPSLLNRQLFLDLQTSRLTLYLLDRVFLLDLGPSRLKLHRRVQALNE